MSPTIWFRIVMGVLGLVAFALSTVIATQNTGLSQTTLVWLGIILSIINFLLASLPSFVRSILPNSVERAALSLMQERDRERPA